MQVVVYGTLKQGNHLSYILDGCQYLEPVKIHGYKIYHSGYGFPFVLFTGCNDDYFYGELYEVDDSKLKILDSVESEGTMYNRVDIALENKQLNIQPDESFLNVPTYLYVGIIEVFQRVPMEIVKNNYWIQEDTYRAFNLLVHNRYYNDEAKKIVFDMRFYDFGKSRTNKEYMQSVNKRLKNIFDIEVNTDNEQVFLTDLILNNRVIEIK